MHRNKAAILALAGSIFFATSTAAEATDLDKVNGWITSNKPWEVCPTAKTGHGPLGKPNPNNPYFPFNNNAQLSTVPPLGSCRQSGGFKWHPTKKESGLWWVQVISNLRPKGCTGDACLHDLIRVCSLDYVRPDNSQPFPGGGPCQTAQGVGVHGCEACTVPAP